MCARACVYMYTYRSTYAWCMESRKQASKKPKFRKDHEEVQNIAQLLQFTQNEGVPSWFHGQITTIVMTIDE